MNIEDVDFKMIHIFFDLNEIVRVHTFLFKCYMVFLEQSLPNEIKLIRRYFVLN